mmetsp:Transcript_46985/g.77756  ORF Transcript_46985/g.77756 Transcript_46985/m.77756 type:complete len:259 (-) Transcript_46985:71-847(-)
MMCELTAVLYGGRCPYTEAKHAGSLPDPDSSYPHTHLSQELAEQLLKALAATLDGNDEMGLFVVECGSFVGGSAVRLARALKACAQQGAAVLCIDPFCGDAAMWSNHNGWRDWLQLGGGRPRLFEQFVSNVLEAELESMILPMCTTSCAGLGALRRLHMSPLPGVSRIPRPHLIYLDTAHEEGETLVEVRAAYELLRPGGFLLGDDWNWPAVRSDVLRFAHTQRLSAIELPDTIATIFSRVLQDEHCQSKHRNINTQM